MTRPFLVAALAAATCTFLSGCNQPTTTETAAPAGASTAAATPATTTAPDTTTAATKPAPTDFDQLADRLVANAGVKEGEVVMITGRSSDAELLEDIAVAARKVGASPMISYSSDRLAKRMFFDVPEKYDSQTDALGMKLAEHRRRRDLARQRNAAKTCSKAPIPSAWPRAARPTKAVGQAFLKNGVRSVEIGNNLYPTTWRAEAFRHDRRRTVEDVLERREPGLRGPGEARQRRQGDARRPATKCTSRIPTAPISPSR